MLMLNNFVYEKGGVMTLQSCLSGDGGILRTVKKEVEANISVLHMEGRAIRHVNPPPLFLWRRSKIFEGGKLYGQLQWGFRHNVDLYYSPQTTKQ